jgi:hypothetical protein
MNELLVVGGAALLVRFAWWVVDMAFTCLEDEHLWR